MENTYFISDYNPTMNAIVSQLGLSEEQVISYQRFENEWACHDWTRELFKGRVIDKLFIPISLSSETLNSEGLKIAMHIRLNYELSLEKRLTPIVFLSDFEMDTILTKNHFDNDSNHQYLLFTKGVALYSFDIAKIKDAKVNLCPEKEYHTSILSKLKIAPKDSTGKHSIANAWGCFKLALISGNKKVIENKEISNDLKTLYAKYLICLNDIYLSSSFCDLNPLNFSKKKILFVDDQADEGWGVLMEKIFSKSDITVVDSSKYKNQETKQFHDFDGFYTECESHIGKEWDLIIIDLRLYPEKEDIDNALISPKDFFGYKLIDKFLSFDEGYQIIIFTASNKIWNINAAIKRGAYSYYIKESPEFNYSIQESREQYEILKRDIKECFDRKYLFDIYELHKKFEKFIEKDKSARSDRYKRFYDRTLSLLKIAFELLKQSNEPKHLNFSYLSYYQIIEDYAGQAENFEYEDGIGYNVNKNLVIDEKGKERKLIFKDKTITHEKYSFFEKGMDRCDEKPTALAKISFILAYKFDKDNIFLKEWGRLNHLRNTATVHGGKDENVSIDDLKSLLNIIDLFLTNS